MSKMGKFLLFLLVVLLAAPPAHGGDDQGRLKITYMGFADSVEVDGERFNYSFVYESVPRGAALQLTPAQTQLFVDWLAQCQVFSLVGPDVLVAEPNHPGAGERNSLVVEHGDMKIELSWGGVSHWNDRTKQDMLERAVDELTKLSFRLVREADLL